jgi:hypothetical protein
VTCYCVRPDGRCKCVVHCPVRERLINEILCNQLTYVCSPNHSNDTQTSLGHLSLFQLALNQVLDQCLILAPPFQVEHKLHIGEQVGDADPVDA